jgi:DNA-binding SARP family transcriptional activator
MRVVACAVPLVCSKQLLSLLRLFVEPGRIVSVGRMMDELWGAALPADPRAALRTQVSRLRGALGPAGGDLLTLEPGYRLLVQRSQLDAARFEDTMAEATQAGGEQALGLLDEALALWRGPAISEFADRPFAMATAARLNERRVVAAERRAELLLSADSVDDAIAVLQALVVEHPERERARRRLGGRVSRW